jgi:RHS repeat-associated protein
VTPSNATNPTNDGLSDYKNTDYVGNIVYETAKNGSAITNRTRILVDGGYYEGGVYYYYLTDHLGNNRVVVNQSGTVTQKNHYYPFGTAFADKYDNGTNQPYKYNGKELDQMHQLNLYDYSARYYESAQGRFTSVDPLAEKYYSISPYAYCYNNPLRFIDPDGKAPMGGAGGGGPIILGGPAFWTHRSKIGNALASILGMKDLFTLTTALLEPISGKPAATFDFTDNGIEFTPVSANDVENSKNAILIPGVSGKGLGKAGQIADDIAGAAAKTNNAIVSHAGKEVPVFRGGNSLMVKPNEIKIKDGLVQPTHGVSVNVNSDDVAKFGGAYEVKNLPSGLKMLQRGKDVGHFEIVPTKAIPIEDYQKLLNQIELSPVK